MLRLSTIALSAFALTLAHGAVEAGTQKESPRIGIKPPKLVVVISIDQFRADYVSRFAPHYLPARQGKKVGGFRFLSEDGAWFQDAHHNHVPTATGPGHATLLTGSEPALNGIIGNDWFDRIANKPHYVVEDSTVESIGGKGGQMSPRPLLTTTVGDELKMATNGHSKVVGIAIKDRAAILMAGHAADTVIWFDSSSGNWVTSSWYAKTGKLPAWVERMNSSRGIDKALGTNWEPLLPASAYAFARKAPGEKPSPNSSVFSHALGTPGGKADKAYYGALTASSIGNEWVFSTVKSAVDEEKLGQRGVPDMLCFNLSTNDYVGHRYGPNSPEVLDISVRTDRLLSDLFNYLDAKVGLDNVTIVVSADHGVVPIAEEMSNIYQIPALRTVPAFGKVVQAALTAKFGEGKWVLGDGLYEQNFYLNRETVAEKKLSMEEVEEVAAATLCKQPGVYTAFTRTQILKGELPKWGWVTRASNGYHPILGGDVMVFEAPGVYFGGGTGTGHGTAWDYDSHVPILLRGAGIVPGKYTRRVATADIASTLSLLLGIEYPSGNLGTPLAEALPVRKH